MTSPIPTGSVRWHVQVAVPDSADLDTLADVAPADGTVTFTPATSELRYISGTDPTTVLLGPMTFGFGSDGILRDQGNPTVSLPADAANPGAWTWRVTATINGRDYPPFSFHLAPGETVDLTQVAPVPMADGTWYNVGPAGPVGINALRGPWSAATAYVARDVVSYGGSSWVAKTASTGVTPVEGASWTLLAAQGPSGSVSGVPDATTTANGIVRLAGDISGTAAAPTVTGGTHHGHTASQISDATTVGRALMVAVDGAAARTAIGAGTSSLSIGTTSTTAAAGNDSRITGAAPTAAVEGLAIFTTVWPSRPSGYARVRWVGGTTQPAAMVAGDVWEHDA